jgi:hypothetical protein
VIRGDRSLEELRADHLRHLAEQADRERRWHLRRRHFIARMALAGGILLMVSARMAAFGGSMAWPAYLLLFAAGAALGWIIARFGFGILRGMLLYGMASFAAWLLCLACGWWGMAASGGMAMMGPLLLMFCAWLGWGIIGAVLGLVSVQFEDDTVEI